MEQIHYKCTVNNEKRANAIGDKKIADYQLSLDVSHTKMLTRNEVIHWREEMK